MELLATLHMRIQAALVALAEVQVGIQVAEVEAHLKLGKIALMPTVLVLMAIAQVQELLAKVFLEQLAHKIVVLPLALEELVQVFLGILTQVEEAGLTITVALEELVALAVGVLEVLVAVATLATPLLFMAAVVVVQITAHQELVRKVL
jgi:hypothetical protein